MEDVFVFAIVFIFLTFFFQYSETHAYSVIDEEVETNLSHEVCSIYARVGHNAIHTHD